MDAESSTPKDLARSMVLSGIYFKGVFEGYKMAIKDCDTYTFIKYEERELVLLYNASKFEMVADSQATHLTYPRPHGSRDAVLSACFRSKATGDVVRVGSMHGEYGVDYTESVPQLLESFQEAHVVIGGDMNYPPNYEISNLQVRDEKETTNFFTNYDAVGDGYTKVELNDPRSGTPKAYDGFITNMKEVEISGAHTWSKSVDEAGIETPCLVAI